SRSWPACSPAFCRPGTPARWRRRSSSSRSNHRRTDMELRSILSSLRRHKISAALIVLEIALSCAIICSAMFLIGGRLERMDRPTGMVEDELVRIQITGIGTDDNAAALTQSDLAVLRALPGVKSASVTNQVTFGGGSWNSGVSLSRDQTHVNMNVTTY